MNCGTKKTLFAISCFFTITFHSSYSYICSYFSPDEGVADVFISYINTEQKSIRIACYLLTHLQIAKALIRAVERGVLVELVIDQTSLDSSGVHKLLGAGIPIFVYVPPMERDARKPGHRRNILMHNKFCIFESQGLLWTGSFNFTLTAAEANQENVVILDDPATVRRFSDRFLYLKVRSEHVTHISAREFVDDNGDEADVSSGFLADCAAWLKSLFA